MIYVLDACAMIALVLQEPGEEVVWARLLEMDATCFAHSINPPRTTRRDKKGKLTAAVLTCPAAP